MVYTITPSPALDYVMKVKEFSDDISRAESAELYFGGKGINVSAVLSQLGVPCVALGFIGGFTGKKLCRMLDKSGINHDFITLKKGETRINVKIRCGRELDINAPGPEVSEADIKKLYEKLDGIKDGDFLVLAGSVPKNIPADFYNEILSRINSGALSVVDVAGPALLSTLSHRPFLIKPNNFELGELFGKTVNSAEEIIECAKSLQKKGARNVLVSCGKNGAVLICENGDVYPIAAMTGKLVNSVGCGDSMVAGFLAGYIKTGNTKKALKLSVAASAATAFSEALATKEKINLIINQMQ